MKKYVIILIMVSIVFSMKIYATPNEESKYIYHINSTNTEKDLSCWVGWKKYHYGETEVLERG